MMKFNMITPETLLEIGKHSIARSIWTIQNLVAKGLASGYVGTTTPKYKDGSPLEDLTTYADKVAESVIMDYLEEKLRKELGLNYVVSTEEEGTIKHLQYKKIDKNVELDIIVFIDPVDFTESVVRGLDGSSLITFYSLTQKKILASVVGDVRDQKLYFSCEDYPAAYSQYIEYIKLPEKENTERITDENQYRISSRFNMLRPSAVTEISRAHINCLINKKERLIPLMKRIEFINQLGDLGRLYCVGGSLGITRVAAGILDGAVEFAKGFKEWDCWPGLYICKKANAPFRDLNGEEINLELKIEKNSSLEHRLRNPKRQTFIVAGNETLIGKFEELQLMRES